MAKIHAEFDTADKTLSVKVNGKPVDNVSELHLSKGYSKDSGYNLHLLTTTHDEDEGTTHHTHLVASESEEGKTLRATASESKDFDGFLVVEPKSQAQTDIEKFFGAE